MFLFHRYFGLLSLLLLTIFHSSNTSGIEYIPSESNYAAREWFQNAKFGLFIHWGIYSILGDGEWILHKRGMKLDSYKKLAEQFYPLKFNPAVWVKLAKDAGAKYITITAKHHDGFALFDSSYSNWNIVKSTPYKDDVLKALAYECRKEGIKLFFYYSQLDWYHSDYFPRGHTGTLVERPDSGVWSKYITFMNDQIIELMTNYGPIAGIWFDGWWDKPDADWDLEGTYSIIHRLNPSALIANNHHQKPFYGEDFQIFEKDLPGQNTAGFNEHNQVSQLPLETCETINNSWGFNLEDKKFKSVRTLIHHLVRAAGHGTNFLLNIGPMPNGSIQSEFVERLEAMGTWLQRYGNSLYNTRKGPITPRSWGVTTAKDDTIYVHILDWNYNDTLVLPLKNGIKAARCLTDNKTVLFEYHETGILLSKLADHKQDPYDTVIELKVNENSCLADYKGQRCSWLSC